MERRKEGQKVGSVFPKNPNEEGKIPSQFETLIEIYKNVSQFYNEEEWTMKDFKSFRSKLASRSIGEISCLGEFIVAFLSFPKEKQRVLAKAIDEKFQFSILVERQKFIIIDDVLGQETEYYRGVERPFEMGDIVTFSNAIWAESIRLVNIDTSNILNEMLRESSSNEALSFLTKLLHSNGEDMNNIIETVLSDFDIHFDDLLKMKEFASPLLMQRENIPLYIQEVIRRRITAIKTENSNVIRNYINDAKDTNKMRQAKMKKRHEGYRHLS